MYQIYDKKNKGYKYYTSTRNPTGKRENLVFLLKGKVLDLGAMYV
jgi:hypothetical protein